MGRLCITGLLRVAGLLCIAGEHRIGGVRCVLPWLSVVDLVLVVCWPRGCRPRRGSLRRRRRPD